MREAAADRAALADGIMADGFGRVRQHRASAPDQLALLPARHGAPARRSAAGHRRLAMPLELIDAVDVDQAFRPRQPHVQHRRQTLAARDQLGVVVPGGEALQHFLQRRRRFVGESAGLHRRGPLQQRHPGRLVEQMQPLGDETELDARSLLVSGLLVDAYIDILAFDLEADEAVGADRQDRIHHAGQRHAGRRLRPLGKRLPAAIPTPVPAPPVPPTRAASFGGSVIERAPRRNTGEAPPRSIVALEIIDRGIAEKGGHEHVARPLVDVVGIADLLDHAILHDHDPVGQASAPRPDRG